MRRITGFGSAALAALAVWTVGPVARGAIANLTIQSTPGDFVGGGQTANLTYNSATGSTVSAQVRRSLNGAPAELLFDVDQNGAANTFALLFFGTDQLGIAMQPGVYTNAERADFADPGHPGLDVDYQNRGSNTLTGSFIVTDFTYTGSTIISFAATFQQFSGGSSAPLNGSFTYALPEPAGMAGLALLVIGGIRRRR